MNGRELERAREALQCIPPDLPREEWVRVGMGALAAGLSFDDFDSWSAGAGNYDASDARDTWRSFRDTGPSGRSIGAGTLYRVAAEHGWRMKAGIQRKARSAQPRLADCKPLARAGHAADEVWARCEPATTDHPYVVQKEAQGVPLSDLRVVPQADPLRVLGVPMRGALVVPCRRSDGSLVTLQFITTPETAKRLKAEGRTTKPNLPGHPVEGWHVVGADTPMYVCEGIGTAWAAWRATGKSSVCAFGWGRVRAVAQALRERFPSAPLVLVPDAGKEAQASEIARNVGALVATMPEGWPQNSDIADLAARDGLEVLKALLTGAKVPEHEQHPLANFIPLDGQIRPPRWVVPGFIAEGLLTIAGEPGVGKTTCLLPLALAVAGLCARENPLRPRQWRHVVYITEDAAQAQRVLAGVRDHGQPRLDASLVAERFHLVEACRLPPDEMVKVGLFYRQRLTRTVDGAELLPLVVLDTRSAVLSANDENNNAEASEAVAALKQRFEGLPTWVVGHLPKSLSGRTEARALSIRGAGAWEGDANQTLYIVREGEQRFIVEGKRRFEAQWPELTVQTYTADVVAEDEFGEPCSVRLRWGIPVPPEKSRSEARQAAQEDARKRAEAELRDAVRNAVQLAWQGGLPLNKTGVIAKMNRKAGDVSRILESLLAERWLLEVPIPSHLRTNPRRASFLVNLSTEEHEAVIRGAPLPADKVAIPTSMTKAAA